VQAQTHDGRTLRILTLIDERSRACLALKVARRINSLGVIEALADAMCLHGIPEHVRCDNVLRSESPSANMRPRRDHRQRRSRRLLPIRKNSRP
jgi:hypothetical protein